MTREEAIEILRHNTNLGYGIVIENEDTKIIHDALDMAIEALKQEPCETQMIDKSNFSKEQYKADLQSAYDCGKASVKACEDAVSKKEVLKKIRKHWLSGTVAYRIIDAIYDDIRELPSVTPIHRDRTVQDFADKCRECGKQKKGKWITNFHGFPQEPSSVCSECGFDRDFYVRTRGFDKLNYCPNCGVKMESEDKE